MVPSRAPMTVLQAPSATESTAIVPSVRNRPAHREGKRGALFMDPFYCIAIPAGIGLMSILSGLIPGPRSHPWPQISALTQDRQRAGDQGNESDRHQRVALQPALALDD